MKTKSSLLVIFFIVLITSCQNKTINKLKTVDISFKKECLVSIINEANDIIASYDVEIANTPYERQTGLMYRDKLEKSQGMLFVFDEEAELNFYMKNTLLPLDLIFINKNKSILNIFQNASPNSINSIPSKGNAMYVLELLAFETKTKAIQPGMKIQFNSYD